MILGFVSFTEFLWLLLVLGVSLAAILLLVAAVGWFAWFLSRKTPVAPPQLPNPPPPKPTVPPSSEADAKSRTPVCPRCGQVRRPANDPRALCPRCVLAAGLETAAPDPRNSKTSELPPIQEIGHHFPGLELLEPLGQGGMGWVYKARQIHLDRIVALKVLPPQVATDPSFAQRFQREARALASLSHPHIVAIHEFGQVGPFYYFVMEYVDGGNLRHLQRNRRITPEEAVRLIPGICDALQFAHTQGVIHRDIKPENILVDSKGRVKIADFGIAKLTHATAETDLTRTHHPLGSPRYMAPEQFDSPDTIDHRADLFALGVVFYEMLTGELPVGRFALPSQRVAVDVRLDEVVLKSLEQSRERRYQTATAVKDDIERIGNQPHLPNASSPSNT